MLTLSVFIMPCDQECECKKVCIEDGTVYVEKDQTDGMVITAIQRLVLLAHYGDFTAVMAYVFDNTHPAGASSTPTSVAMQCVMNSTGQYVSTYLMLLVAIFVHQFFAYSVILISVLAIYNSSQKTVTLSWMRALQLARATDGTIPTRPYYVRVRQARNDVEVESLEAVQALLTGFM